MKPSSPPKFVVNFFKWFCHPKLHTYIEGDLLELYRERVEESGKKKADWRFALEVLLLIRPGIIRPLIVFGNINYFGMWKHYLKISWRNLVQNKAYSLLNIFGLTLGIAAFLLILNYVLVEISYDNFHKDASQIYRIRNDHFSKGLLTNSRAITYRDAGPSMKDDFPEVLDFTRMNGLFGRGLVVTYTDQMQTKKFVEEEVYYVDDNFFSIFSFPLLKGDSSKALKDINSVVITETIAYKYFGNENPIGKVITINGENTFQIMGVLEDIPFNSHMKFHFLFPIKSLPDYQYRNAGKWGGMGGDVAYTYIKLQDHIDPVEFEQKLPDFLTEYQHDRVKGEGITDKFILQPLRDIHLHSDLEFEMEVNGNAKLVVFLIIIASIILFIAWINYTNLSMVRATTRGREVGVRKVVGASKAQIAKQFITQALILNFIALVLSIFTVINFFPLFEKFTGYKIDFVLFNNTSSLVLLTLFLLLGAVISGSYPAFFIASFKPITTLKGRSNQKVGGIPLVKGLTIFQYAISVALITGTFTVFKQVDFMQHQDLGVQVDKVLVIRAPQVVEANYFTLLNSFRTEILRNPDFVEVSASSEVPGKVFSSTSWVGPVNASFDQFKRYSSAWIDYNFIPLFSLKLLYGRNFSEDFTTDENAILVNEEFAKSLDVKHLNEVIDQVVMTNRGERKIIGVIDNYHQTSLRNAIEPAVFYLNTERNKKYISVKLKSKDLSSAVHLLKDKYESIFPNDYFEFFFLDDYYNQQYQADWFLGKIASLFTSLAILITCLGLFSLSFTTTFIRIKEIAVRRILGASVSSIFFLFSLDFMKLIFIGTLIGIPIIWLILQEWLSNYAFSIDISFWLLLLPVVIIMVIGVLTISYHILKAALSNSIDSLRSE